MRVPSGRAMKTVSPCGSWLRTPGGYGSGQSRIRAAAILAARCPRATNVTTTASENKYHNAAVLSRAGGDNGILAPLPAPAIAPLAVVEDEGSWRQTNPPGL